MMRAIKLLNLLRSFTALFVLENALTPPLGD